MWRFAGNVLRTSLLTTCDMTRPCRKIPALRHGRRAGVDFLEKECRPVGRHCCFLPITVSHTEPLLLTAVNAEIRKRYTESQEFALLRQRDDKPAEFAEYSAYCEVCKTLVKAKKGIDE